MLFVYCFFLSINAPTIAIAMIMSAVPAISAGIRSGLTAEVAAGVVDVGDAVVVIEATVADVDAEEGQYELLPVKVA